jgi:hypothetical protein
MSEIQPCCFKGCSRTAKVDRDAPAVTLDGLLPKCPEHAAVLDALHQSYKREEEQMPEKLFTCRGKLLSFKDTISSVYFTDDQLRAALCGLQRALAKRKEYQSYLRSDLPHGGHDEWLRGEEATYELLTQLMDCLARGKRSPFFKTYRKTLKRRRAAGVKKAIQDEKERLEAEQHAEYFRESPIGTWLEPCEV